MSVKSVEEYIENHAYWKDELESIRELICSTELVEEIKWGGPCYTLEGKNLVGFGAFQNHCAIWLYQGALLTENTALLHNAQEGKTKALRQIRIVKGQTMNIELLKKYVLESIQLQKDGKEIKPEYNHKVVVPEELKSGLEHDDELKSAFERLTKARQREYAEYISGAKRDETKIRRLEKIGPMILSGVGLNDKYRKAK
jgi:uncharacterized protein YdeI (YjbR/CyaY-like superfamily)